MRKQKGFTLIELLVVIAIIGLLSTLAIVSLNTARAKARDAKRVADVRQMATILAMEATTDENAALLLVDNLTACDNGTLTTLCANPNQVSQFSKFIDPSNNSTACDITAAVGAIDCDGVGGSTCAYTVVTAGATVGNTTIMFCLEDGANSLGKGIHTISQDGVFN